MEKKKKKKTVYDNKQNYSLFCGMKIMRKCFVVPDFYLNLGYIFCSFVLNLENQFSKKRNCAYKSNNFCVHTVCQEVLPHFI